MDRNIGDEKPLTDSKENAFTASLSNHWEKFTDDELSQKLSRDAPEIQHFLQEQKQDGHRWIAYNEEKSPLTARDLHPAKTVFDAQEIVHENNTDLDRYTYTALSKMEKLVQSVMEQDKENTQELKQEIEPEKKKQTREMER